MIKIKRNFWKEYRDILSPNGWINICINPFMYFAYALFFYIDKKGGYNKKVKKC